MSVDALALEVYRRLQADDPRGALALAADALPLTAGRPGLEARLRCWSAQAHIELGAFKPAREALRAALAVAQAAGDPDGESAVAQLRLQLSARQLAAAPPAAELPDTPVGRAAAAFDRGDPEAGARLAREARAAAAAVGDPREEVMALLALARAPGEAEAAVREAADVADRSNDMNLVTAVARAARAAGVALPPLIFGA